MDIITKTIELGTKGKTDIIDITDKVRSVLVETSLQEGMVHVFAIGSTTAITTVEYEPGLVNHDIAEMLQQIAPYGKDYHHNQTWGDDNGGSHLRSTLMGTHFTAPFSRGNLVLGTWQQIIFIDFDTRPRSRKVVVQVMGK
ncbi:MAG: secondary thiamine-phosphate synthase enzyme YjbQ [Cyclobacteriaceae bacterium]